MFFPIQGTNVHDNVRDNPVNVFSRPRAGHPRWPPLGFVYRLLEWAMSVRGRDQCMEPDEEPFRIPITDVFDLHAVHPKEVEVVVEAYLEEAARLGLQTVRIIHGRGTGVQRAIVRAVLARTSFVLFYQDAPPEAGGWGATIARLRLSSENPGCAIPPE